MSTGFAWVLTASLYPHQLDQVALPAKGRPRAHGGAASPFPGIAPPEDMAGKPRDDHARDASHERIIVSPD